jgi:hypothetical protein
MNLNKFQEVINVGIQDHKGGKVFTSKEVLVELRFHAFQKATLEILH